MKLLKKGLLGVIAGTMITGSLNAADKFVPLPIFNDSTYKTNIEVALVGGMMNFSEDDVDSNVVYGVEVSLDCPVFTLPGDNLLRQQFSVNRYSDTGIDITTIEVNPYYFITLTDDMVLGFGPGIGGALVDIEGGDSTWNFTYQAGAGIKYYVDKFLIGVDARWQGSNAEENLDNTRFMAKVGYRF